MRVEAPVVWHCSLLLDLQSMWYSRVVRTTVSFVEGRGAAVKREGEELVGCAKGQEWRLMRVERALAGRLGCHC